MPPMRVEPATTVYDLLRAEQWTLEGRYTYVGPNGDISISVAVDDMNDTVIVDFLVNDWVAAGAVDLARKFRERVGM